VEAAAVTAVTLVVFAFRLAASHGAVTKHDRACVRERCEHRAGEGSVSHASRLVLQREAQQRQQRRVQQRCQVAVLPLFSARVVLGAGTRGRVRGTGLRSVHRTYTAELGSAFGAPSADMSLRHRRMEREKRHSLGSAQRRPLSYDEQFTTSHDFRTTHFLSRCSAQCPQACSSLPR